MRDVTDKRKKLEQLNKELEELEKIRLPRTMKKFGQSLQEGRGEWEIDPNVTLADDEVVVLTSLISDLRTEIARLEKELGSAK